jgi:hypothetical protein
MIRRTSTVAATGFAIVALLALLAVAAPLVLPGSPTAIASAAASGHRPSSSPSGWTTWAGAC